jgi:hypothetical protein
MINYIFSAGIFRFCIRRSGREILKNCLLFGLCVSAVSVVMCRHGLINKPDLINEIQVFINQIATLRGYFIIAEPLPGCPRGAAALRNGLGSPQGLVVLPPAEPLCRICISGYLIIEREIHCLLIERINAPNNLQNRPPAVRRPRSPGAGQCLPSW